MAVKLGGVTAVLESVTTYGARALRVKLDQQKGTTKGLCTENLLEFSSL